MSNDNFLKADPNLVPYQASWTDNIGGMANAIFWLEENWRSDMNAQGDYVPDPEKDGTRWFWNYSPTNGTILVHRNGSKEWFQVDREKVIHVKNGIEEMADYYRPYFRKDDPSQIEWLKTREVAVIKNHHRGRIPLYVKSAISELHDLLSGSSLTQFPTVKLHFLLHGVLKKEGAQRLSAHQKMAYFNLMANLNTLKTTFSEYHHGTGNYSKAFERSTEQSRRIKTATFSMKVLLFRWLRIFCGKQATSRLRKSSMPCSKRSHTKARQPTSIRSSSALIKFE
jgi:hypothetical protein